jgi:hypothetical protein
MTKAAAAAASAIPAVVISPGSPPVIPPSRTVLATTASAIPVAIGVFDGFGLRHGARFGYHPVSLVGRAIRPADRFRVMNRD